MPAIIALKIGGKRYSVPSTPLGRVRFLVTSDTRKKSGAVKPCMLATMRAEPVPI